MGFARAVKGAAFSVVAGAERVLRPGQRREPLSRVRNVLLLQYSAALGPAVHATPLVAGIRQAMPDARIVVAANGLAAGVFRNHPQVDQLFETPSPLSDLRGAVRALRVQRLFAQGAFAALTTQGNERTLIGLAAFLAGIPYRVGYTEVPQLYQSSFRRDATRSLIDDNLRLIETFGRPAQHIEPQIFFTQQDADYARELLARDARPIAVFVTQNSGGQRTGWHMDRFVHVLRHVEASGYRIVYVGTTKDAPAIEAIRSEAGGIGVSLAGRTSIPQLTALLAQSDIIVSLDTGTMHVGRAAGTPMVVLGPSWQRPIEWLPLGIPHVRILRGEDRDTIPANYQLDEITAESVVSAFDELMQLYPPSAADRERRVQRSLAAQAEA